MICYSKLEVCEEQSPSGLAEVDKAAPIPQLQIYTSTTNAVLGSLYFRIEDVIKQVFSFSKATLECSINYSFLGLPQRS